jgi:hypothetical protein
MLKSMMNDSAQTYVQQIQDKGYASIPSSYFNLNQPLKYELNQQSPTFYQRKSSKISLNDLKPNEMHNIIAADKDIVLHTRLFNDEEKIHFHLSQTTDELYSDATNNRQESFSHESKIKLLFIHYLNKCSNDNNINSVNDATQHEARVSLQETIVMTYECHCRLTVFHAKYQHINGSEILAISFSS